MSALSAETLSEHELIDAARGGDDRAFEELYARYRGRITGFIHARVHDHGRSEDVAQEVFISALRRLRASSQDIQFKPWIYEIAKNACIDEHRRIRRVHEISFDGTDDETGPARLPSRAPTPPAAVETKQTLTDLRGAFGGLSDLHHQLLVLREFEGLSYDQIGERTGMSRQMVESALFRARRKLTEEYEELASGRRCRQIQSMIDDGRALVASSLGIRERRVFARHLAHCQTCRVAAHLAGVDENLVSRRRLGAKIAALLPFPLWRWPRGAARSRHALAQAGGHPAMQTLSHAAEPAAATSLGGAAVAAAVLALAGAGTVSAPAAIHAQRPSPPAAAVRSAPSRHAVAPPPVVRPASGTARSARPAVRYGRGHLRAGTVSKTAAARASAQPTRRGQRSSGRSGTTGHSSGRRANGGGAPPPAAPLASAPTGLTSGASGSGAAKTLSGLAHRGSHLLPSLPLPSTPTIPGAATQTAGSTLAGVQQAVGGAVPAAAAAVAQVATGAAHAATGAGQAATGAARAATGATQAATGAAQAATGAGQAATGAARAATGATRAATGATRAATGATQAATGAAQAPTGAAQAATGAVNAVSGHAAITVAQVAGAGSQTAAAATAGVTKTVAPLLPGASGH